MIELIGIFAISLILFYFWFVYWESYKIIFIWDYRITMSFIKLLPRSLMNGTFLIMVDVWWGSLIFKVKEHNIHD